MVSFWSSAWAVGQHGMSLFKATKVALNIPTATRNMVSNFLQNGMRPGHSFTTGAQ